MVALVAAPSPWSPSAGFTGLKSATSMPPSERRLKYSFGVLIEPTES